MNLDIQKFNKVVADAKAKAPQMAHKIDAAAENLIRNPYIHDTGAALLILSDSGNIYEASSNGNHCGCKASEFKQLCWHRLSDRLYRLYLSKRGN